jgi:hypothetical protein
MLSFNSMNRTGRTDAELVGATLARDRNVFAEIVSRYQTQVCSLAYRRKPRDARNGSTGLRPR